MIININYIRVGIGGGSGCITTSNVSAHYPQASLIDECKKIKDYYEANYARALPAIIADGQHQRADVFTSVAILIGVLVSNMGYPILDPILAIIIGLIIIRTAIKIFIENVNHIVGRIPSEDFIEQIKDVANSVPQAQNAHAVKINNMGSYSTVSLHISLDEDTVLKESHKIAHDVQDKIMTEIPEIKYVTVHTCPLGEEYNHKQEIDG